jgi:hypothetical protein
LQVSGWSQMPLEVRQVVPELPAVCAHDPALHWSTVHGFESLEQPVPLAAAQLSAASLQTLLHSGPVLHGSPLPTHTPAEQLSLAVQKRPSLHGEPFASMVHVDEQQSPFTVLPSSQASPPCLVPSPQTADAVELVSDHELAFEQTIETGSHVSTRPHAQTSAAWPAEQPVLVPAHVEGVFTSHDGVLTWHAGCVGISLTNR